MKKRVISIMLALVLLIGAAPSVFAAGTAFTDVAPGVWYEEAVNWAVEKGITSGVGEGLFAPEATCTRAQVVTFLWRSQGSPEPAAGKNPFIDVSKNDYFYKAVLWAVENGITAGVLPTRFGPHSPCTRAQVATFLWRSKGESEPAGGSNPFADVSEDDYFYKAVLWAVENGVTSGTSDSTFSPDSPCTRAQIVTFLHRADSESDGDNRIWMPVKVSYNGYAEGYGALNGYSVYYNYDSQGRIIGAHADNVVGSLSIEYADNGRPAFSEAKTSIMHQKYRWIYDDEGNVVAEFLDDIITFGSQTEYDDAGRVIREEYVDEGGGAVCYIYSYNEAGLISEVKQPRINLSGNTFEKLIESYTYDEQGRVTQFVEYTYTGTDTYDYTYSQDGLTVTAKVFSNAGGDANDKAYIVITEFDSNDRVISEKKTYYETHSSYEPYTEVEEAEETVYTYDAEGRLIHEKKVTGRKVLEDEFVFKDAAEIRETAYTYDERGELLSVISDIAAYDTRDYYNPVFVENFAKDEEYYSYNEAGEPVHSLVRNWNASKNEAGEYSLAISNEEESSWEYDAQGRLISNIVKKDYKEYNNPDIRKYTWNYDAQGRLIEESEETGNWFHRHIWEYDTQGRLIRDADLQGETDASTGAETLVQAEIYEYSYNDAGDLAAFAISDASGVIYSEVYSYDSEGRQTGTLINDNGAVIRTEIGYNVYGMPKEMITTYEAEGIVIRVDYSYAKQRGVPMDAMTLQLIENFESHLQ